MRFSHVYFLKLFFATWKKYSLFIEFIYSISLSILPSDDIKHLSTWIAQWIDCVSNANARLG